MNGRGQVVYILVLGRGWDDVVVGRDGDVGGAG